MCSLPNVQSGYARKHFVYQLGTSARYIGQGAVVKASRHDAGIVCRFREHLRLWHLAARGQARIPNKHRYSLLSKRNGMSISFLVIDVVQTSVVYAVEAARIAFAQPSSNFLDEKASGRLGMPVRIGKQRKRLTRSQRVARRKNIHENITTHDKKTSWLLNLNCKCVGI